MLNVMQVSVKVKGMKGSEMEKHEIVNRVGCLKMRLGWYYRYCNHIALVKSIGMNG